LYCKCPKINECESNYMKMYMRILIYCRFFIYYRKSIAILSVNENSAIKMLNEIKTSFICLSISLLEAGAFMVGTYDHRNALCTIDVDGNEGDVQHKFYLTRLTK